MKNSIPKMISPETRGNIESILNALLEQAGIPCHPQKLKGRSFIFYGKKDTILYTAEGYLGAYNFRIDGNLYIFTLETDVVFVSHLGAMKSTLRYITAEVSATGSRWDMMLKEGDEYDKDFSESWVPGDFELK